MLNYDDKTKEELIKEFQHLQKEYSSLLTKYQKDIVERERTENIINQKEQSFKEIIDLAPDAFFQGDTKGNFIEVNQKAIELTGFPREELLQMNMKDLFPPTELNNKPLRYDLLAKGEIVINERDIATKTGNSIVVEMNSRKMPDGTYQSSFRDISDRKRTEAALKLSEEKFRKAFIISPDSININRVEDGMYVSINKGFTQIMGYTEDEILGKTSLELDIWENTEDRQRLVFELKNKGYVNNLEAKFRSKSGKLVDGLMSAAIIVLEGKPHILSTTRDITEHKRAEEKIRKMGDHYQALIEKATDGIVLLDAEGKFKFVSPSAKKMFGYNIIDEITGDPAEFTYPEDLHLVLSELKKLLEDSTYIPTLQYRFIGKNGKWKWVESTFSNLLSDPSVESIVINFRDITDRKEAEKALRESEERYRTVITNAPMVTFVTDEKGVFTLSEGIGLAKLGLQPGQVVGMSVLDVYKDYPSIIESMKNALTGKTQRDEVEVQGIVFDVVYSPIFDQNGKVIKVIGVSNDITERKHAELLLQEKSDEIESQNEEYQQINEELIQTNEELYKAKENAESAANLLQNITDNIPAFIAVVDANTLKYEFVNQKFVIGFNRKRENIIGAHISEIIGEANAQFAMPYIEDVRRGNKSGYINTFQLAEGYRYISVSYVPGYDDKGKVDKIIVLSFDVTALKESELELLKAKEKAEESDRLKTSFLQNMSHEIRTPMNAIMGFADLLSEQYNNKPKIEQYSQIINRRCNDLLDIINDILDIAKIESGQLTVNIEDCNLNTLFLELTSFFTASQKHANKKHIEFSLAANINPSEIVIATDKVKLKQIFINLISNAFKFTDEGSIEGGCKFDENHNLLFYVSDTGMGIPSEKLDNVFERFTQLNQGSKRLFGGTGLGLSIVKGLVNLLGGEIKLESEVGKGTTFYFSIPYRPAQLTHVEAIAEESFECYFPNKTILIVEDDKFNATYIKEILNSSGLQILFAECGTDAVKMAISMPIDLVLMDIRLPDMDGLEATRQIIIHKPNMKIIAQTAYAAAEDKRKVLNAGCVDFISKPIKRETLLLKMAKQLK